MAQPNSMTLPGRIDPGELRELERIVSECELATDAGRIAKAFALAAGIRELRARITDDMMKDIVQLQDTALGFRTDRDPASGRNGPPYAIQVVKECLIEALLRGAYPVGNEFNIISGRAYFTKEYFQRRCGEVEGVTDVKVQPGVPVLKDGGALVPFKVTWRKNGVEDSIERTIPVRVNAQMGVDAIIGKATRKALKAAYEQMTGSKTSIPDGEVDEAGMVEGTVVNRHPQASGAASLNERLKKHPTDDAKTIDTSTSNEPPAAEPEVAGIDAEPPADAAQGEEDLSDYATFKELCFKASASQVADPDAFEAGWKKIAVQHATQTGPRSKWMQARKQVLGAIRGGLMDWSTGKIRE